MKNPLLALVLFASTSFASPALLACDSLAGAWELSYAIYKDADGKVLQELEAGDVKSLKVLSKGHFSFITVDKDGKFSVAAAGTYVLKNAEYTEMVSYGSDARLLGKTYRFKCQMRDGLWIHSGNEDHLVIEEHWKQVSR